MVSKSFLHSSCACGASAKVRRDVDNDKGWESWCTLMECRHVRLEYQAYTHNSYTPWGEPDNITFRVQGHCKRCNKKMLAGRRDDKPQKCDELLRLEAKGNWDVFDIKRVASLTHAYNCEVARYAYAGEYTFSSCARADSTPDHYGSASCETCGLRVGLAVLHCSHSMLKTVGWTAGAVAIGALVGTGVGGIACASGASIAGVGGTAAIGAGAASGAASSGLVTFVNNAQCDGNAGLFIQTPVVQSDNGRRPEGIRDLAKMPLEPLRAKASAEEKADFEKVKELFGRIGTWMPAATEAQIDKFLEGGSKVVRMVKDSDRKLNPELDERTSLKENLVREAAKERVGRTLLVHDMQRDGLTGSAYTWPKVYSHWEIIQNFHNTEFMASLSPQNRKEMARQYADAKAWFRVKGTMEAEKRIGFAKKIQKCCEALDTYVGMKRTDSVSGAKGAALNMITDAVKTKLQELNETTRTRGIKEQELRSIGDTATAVVGTVGVVLAAPEFAVAAGVIGTGMLLLEAVEANLHSQQEINGLVSKSCGANEELARDLVFDRCAGTATVF